MILAWVWAFNAFSCTERPIYIGLYINDIFLQSSWNKLILIFKFSFNGINVFIMFAYMKLFSMNYAM